MWEESEKNEELLARFEQMLDGNYEAFFDAEHYEYAVHHYLDNKAYPKALKAVDKALQLFPFTVNFMTEKAKVLTFMGKLTEASLFIEQAQELAPFDAEVLVVKAEILLRTGKFEQVLECCQNALHFTNEQENMYKLMAFACQQLGKDQEALQFFMQTFRLNPDNEDVFDEIYKLITPENAPNYVDFFVQLTDKDPYSAHFWEKLGLVFNKIDRYEEAYQAFEYASLIDERFARAYFYMGNALMNLKEYAKAADTYRQALLYENHADFYCHLAAALEKLKQYEKAIQYYQKAFSLDNNYAEACYGIGVCLDKCSRWYEAIHYLKKAVQLNDKSGYFWYALATVEYKMGNILSCLNAYEQANRFISNTDLWLDWSYVFYEQGSLEEAVSLLKEALNDLPENPDIYYRLSAYLFLKGKYKDGFAFLDKALGADFEKHTDFLNFLPQNDIREALLKFIEKSK